MESAAHAAVPLRVGKKMRKRRELDALVGVGSRSGRLLSASSDEGEPWGRRTSRRRRSRPFLRLAAALALCVCVVSAATVLWLFVDVRRQIVSLRIEIDRVTTSSSSVRDAIQLCHSDAKALRANASDLHDRLYQLELAHKELVQRVDNATLDLGEVSKQLSAAPKLADTPRRLAELQRTVADIGSQINGFDGALATARKQAVTAASGVEEVKSLLHQLEERTNDTIANVSANVKRDEQLKSDIAAVNQTLTSQVDILQNRILEMSKPTSTMAPSSTAASTPSTAVPTSNTTAATLTTQQVPPEKKPIVLQ